MLAQHRKLAPEVRGVRRLRLKDPASALTHFIGALLSVAALVVLVIRAAAGGTAWHVVSFAIFGSSLILLYTASTLYHSLAVPARAALVLRKVDHIMIFILIAGTYTPFLLVPLRGPWGWSLFGVIWGCALAGLVMKLFWMGAPRRVTATFYLVMGWLVIIAIYPLVQAVSAATLAWLFAGGASYTVGAVFYSTRWPNPWPGRFGFHEVWHLFVLGGSIAHFGAVLGLVGA
ncbi:MAG TPA: hemolysin [Clostridiales bacterium UBA8153]|nr:hemolysin [Clostridiales bacterium UBA8153]